MLMASSKDLKGFPGLQPNQAELWGQLDHQIMSEITMTQGFIERPCCLLSQSLHSVFPGHKLGPMKSH